MSPKIFEGIKTLKSGRFGSIIIRDFRIHDDLMRNPEMMSQLFQFIDNKFSFILNLRTIKYLEEFLNLKTHVKHIVLDYPIYESLSPQALCKGKNTNARIIKISIDGINENFEQIAVIADLMLRSCQNLVGLVLTPTDFTSNLKKRLISSNS